MIDQAGTMMAQGRSIASGRIQGVNDNMSESHYHGYFGLCYLEEGGRHYVAQDRLYYVHPGEFLIFSLYVMHHSYGQENVPFKRLLVYLSREEVDSEQLLRALGQGIRVYRLDHREKRVVHRMLNDLLKEQGDPQAYHEDCIHTLLNMASLTIARKIQAPVRPEQYNHITDVISYIHQNYQEGIPIDQLTQVSYINPYYLCRKFKWYTNSTITQYMNVTRIMNAQRMFMETGGNITKISRDTGLSNIMHFNRVFKSVMGTTPSNFRKMYKTEAGYCRGTF